MVHKFVKSQGILLIVALTFLTNLVLLTGCGEASQQLESEERENVPRQNVDDESDDQNSGQQEQDDDDNDGDNDGD